MLTGCSTRFCTDLFSAKKFAPRCDILWPTEKKREKKFKIFGNNAGSKLKKNSAVQKHRGTKTKRKFIIFGNNIWKNSAVQKQSEKVLVQNLKKKRREKRPKVHHQIFGVWNYT